MINVVVEQAERGVVVATKRPAYPHRIVTVINDKVLDRATDSAVLTAEKGAGFFLSQSVRLSLIAVALSVTYPLACLGP